MDVKRIEEIAQAEMACSRCDSREPGWILYHGQRTGKLAVMLAVKLNCQVDCDTLYIAGLFHDIGKGNDLHNEVGANLTRDLLSGIVNSSELDTICDVIRYHNQREKSDSFSNYVKLVQDADLIDNVGLIDVWMAFYWSGHHGESIHDHIAYYQGQECRKWRAYMRSHLNYKVSEQMFEERINWEDDLLSRFHKMYFNGI